MGRVTLYVDEDTLVHARNAAAAAGVSMSAWLVQLVRQRTRTEWPPEVVALAGAWRDAHTSDELRGDHRADVAREAL